MSKTASREEQKAFYDDFITRLVSDYTYGNARTEAAIKHAISWIPDNAKRILDLGCGIGWTTYQIKRHNSNAYVLGIDLGSKSIEIAKRLFEIPGLEYVVQDITEWNDVLKPTFDAIVMIDVYEHIPKSDRSKLHNVLNNALAENGIIILTFPSMLMSTSTRENEPEELQPIDEDVSLEDFIKLSRDINGTVMCYKHESIWKSNDYVHAVIQRNPEIIPLRKLGIEKARERGRYVASRLGIEVPGMTEKS